MYTYYMYAQKNDWEDIPKMLIVMVCRWWVFILFCVLYFTFLLQ